jgi:hypothetical protein
MALAGLLGGLEDEHQRAAPGPRPHGQLRGRAEQAGDVHVVAARMHDRHVRAVGVLRPDRRRVVKAGLLVHGQRVHVGPQQHGRPGPAGEDADHAGTADAGRRAVPQLLQPRRDDRGGPVLGERELGMSVQVAVDPGQAGEVGGIGHDGHPCSSRRGWFGWQERQKRR